MLPPCVKWDIQLTSMLMLQFPPDGCIIPLISGHALWYIFAWTMYLRPPVYIASQRNWRTTALLYMYMYYIHSFTDFHILLYSSCMIQGKTQWYNTMKSENIGYRGRQSFALFGAKDIVSTEFWCYDTLFVWETIHYCACWPVFLPEPDKTLLTRRVGLTLDEEFLTWPQFPPITEKLSLKLSWKNYILHDASVSYTMRNWTIACVFLVALYVASSHAFNFNMLYPILRQDCQDLSGLNQRQWRMEAKESDSSTTWPWQETSSDFTHYTAKTVL